jgi:cytochrome c peroxidase
VIAINRRNQEDFEYEFYGRKSFGVVAAFRAHLRLSRMRTLNAPEEKAMMNKKIWVSFRVRSERIVKTWQLHVALVAVVGLGLFVLPSSTSRPLLGQGNGDTKLNCDSTPCDDVARGRAAFNDRNLNRLGGNGRACADCHVPTDSFQLSPATARARFDALLENLAHNRNADDPLFRPVDADDFRLKGDSARDFSNLVVNGLVRVTMPLPPNVKVIDPATGQVSNDVSVDLWRAVMPVFNVAITGPDGVAPIWAPPGQNRVPILGQDPNGPNRQGGYQHDARFGTLQEQARGALFAHAQVTVEPPTGLLDDLAAFQATLFSSAGVESLANAIRSGSTLFPDPDPELNQLEQDGKTIFNRACAQCHGGALHPSTSTSDFTLVRPIAVRYHNIQTACPRPGGDGFLACPERLSRNARTYQITPATGPIQTVTTSDPGRLLLTGQPADLGVMDVTQLRGISKTAPYFHNNSAATLEEVLDHYDAFFRRVARLSPPPALLPAFLSSNGLVIDRGFVLPEERRALLAYLQKL